MNWYDILNMPIKELMPWSVYAVFSFVFGSCLGSFLNVCIWRIPLGESVVIVPSHCPKCNHKIRWFDNVPVIGYLVLGGKCRDCKSRISPRYIIMELLVGTLFLIQAAAGYLNGGSLYMLAAVVIMLSVAVPCAFIDAEHGILPDKLTFFGIISGVLFNFFMQPSGNMTRWDGLILSLIGAAAGWLGLGIFAWVTGKIFKRRTLGWGDVKYAGFIGALLGIPGLLMSLCLASILGVVFYVTGGKKYCKNGTLPFGPFLGTAVYLYVLLFFNGVI